MVKKIVVLALVFFMCASIGFAAEIGGVDVPATIKAGDTDLGFNGAGIRKKFGLKLYVGSLYLGQKSQDADAIINADEPMGITLHIISSLITSKKMEDATREGFENATGDNIEPISAEVEAFIDVFKAQINDGDIFDFIYLPGVGVEIYKNTEKVSVVEGLTFKKALFGIWLCDKPAQKSLKKGMLGL
jgi:hypothetical protein